ncbi:MAG: PAS domain-containing protein [Candidatus Scalindua sp.]|nr:PAS domain-containing protein [Candidatus Scalindua sp.]
MINNNSDIYKMVEKQSRSWLEHSPVCTKIVDLDYNLKYMSSAGIKSLGIDDITPFYGKPYPFDFYPESSRNLTVNNLDKVKETGDVITQEASIVDIEGNELWFHSTLVPVNDDKGLIDYIMIVSIDTTESHMAVQRVMDLNESLEQRVAERTVQLIKTNEELQIEISERKKMEEKLKDSLEQSRVWLDNSPVCTKVVDLDFNLQYMSAAGIKALKIDDVTKLYGKPYPFEFFPESTKISMIKSLEKVKETGDVITGEAPVYDIEGNELWFQATLVPVRDIEGQIDFIIVVSVDINERKKMEEVLLQSEKLKSIGTLTAGISHEFNNILAIISGNVQMLQEKYNDQGGLTKSLHVISKAVNDGAEISRNMLEFAKIKEDAKEFVPTDIRDLIMQSIEFTMPRWKSMAQANSINYQIDKEGMKDVPSIMCNPTKIREVFINIINNALDAMPDGGSLSFSTRASDETVFVNITDTGVGIPEDVKKRIFDPFFSTRAPSGTGLGMSIVYGIVTRHSGKIAVESELGKGSTFTLQFTSTVKTASPVAIPKPEQKTIKTTERNLSILVVDDEEAICTVLSEFLAKSGNKVEAVDNGADAIKLINSEHFDLVLCDLAMPDVSGYDVIKAINGLGKRPRIGIITGWGEKLKPIEGESVKVDFILNKPFDLSELPKHINDVFGAVSR